jgi:hypothetical protein
MSIDEMPEGHEELAGMILVVAPERGPDVVADHVANFLGALRAFQHVPAHRSGRNLGNMLMFGNGLDFLFAQPTQGDAVFKGDHDESLLLDRLSAPMLNR